jgi:hypothetical protein
MMIENFGRPLPDVDKLEYIHSTIQETMNGNMDEVMLETSLLFVEEIREKHLLEG